MFRAIIKKMLQLISFITLLSFGIMYLVFSMMVPENPPTLVETFLSAFIYTTVFSFVLLTAFNLLDYYRPVNDWRSVSVHIAFLTILTLLSYAFATWLVFTLLEHDDLIKGNELVSFLLTMMITIGVLVFFYFQLLVRRNEESKQQAVQAELAALRAQVNPHFLFNSLNSIAALTRIDASLSEKVTEDLAELFRYSLNASKKNTVTLKDEIDACNLYLNIERARFGDRLIVYKEIANDTLTLQIPALIIQPLVENAIKHGFQKINGTFEIKIYAYIQNNRLVLIIEDNGPGFDLAKTEEYFEKGTGLKNTRERIRHQFGGGGDLNLIKNGVQITISISL